MLRSGARVTLALSAIGALLIVCAFVFRVGPIIVFPVPPEAVAHQEGHSYHVDLPVADLFGRLPVFADSMEDFNASTAEVLENNANIGKPHHPHHAISTMGEGRFSHWGTGSQRVYFSSSDGTDPTANGRDYAFRFVALPPPGLAAAAALTILITVGWRARSSPWVVPATIAMTLVAVGTWAYLYFGSVAIALDSATYINFHPWVPLGYPAFLAGVASVLGYLAIPLVQMAALGGAALFLGAGVGRLTGSRVAFSAAVLVVIGYAPLMIFGGYVLSEAVYAALLFVFAGAGLMLLARFTPPVALVAALAGPLAWSVRPAGIFLAIAVLYLALLLLRQTPWRTVALWLLLPAFAGFGTIQLVHNELRGPGATSQMGRILFGQVAFLFDPLSVAPRYAEEAQAIAAVLAPHLDEMDAQPNWRDRHAFSTRDYAARLNAVDAALTAGSAPEFRVREAMLLEFAVGTIARRPAAYLGWVIEDAAWSWQANVLTGVRVPTATEFASYNDRRAERVNSIEQYGLPLAVEQTTLEEARLNGPAAQVIDLGRRMISLVVGVPGVVPALGMLLLVTALAAPFVASATLRGLGFLGAIVHGAILLVSATSGFIPRYAIPTDPLVLVAGIIAIHAIYRLCRDACRTPDIARASSWLVTPAKGKGRSLSSANRTANSRSQS